MNSSRTTTLSWAAALGLWIGLCVTAEKGACPAGDPCTQDRSWSYHRNGSSVYIYGLRNLSEAMKRLGNDVEHLVINGSCLETLDLSQFWLPLLSQITVTHSGVEAIVGSFLPNNNITRLDLSCNRLSNLGSDILKSAPSLRELDISYNKLAYLPDEIKRLENLAIADNPLNCTAVSSHLYDWYQKENGSAVLGDQDTYVICPKVKDTWYKVNYTLRDAFRGEQEKEWSCGPLIWYNCTCKFIRASYHSKSGASKQIGNHLFDVDCSDGTLTNLPPISEAIRWLNVSGNKIRSLDILRNETYKYLERLYADDNLIESLNFLEFSHANLQVLSLKRNRIKSIPTYIIDNVLQRGNFEHMYLSDNYLHCDCMTVSHFQKKLELYNQFYTDNENLMCESPQKRVMEMTIEEVCQQEQEELWITLLYFLVALEAVLVVGLLARLIYDARRFHRTGYLPWLSAKMPPLPCDCMLETLSPSEKTSTSRSWSGTSDTQWDGSTRGPRRAERVPLNHEDI